GIATQLLACRGVGVRPSRKRRASHPGLQPAGRPEGFHGATGAAPSGQGECTRMKRVPMTSMNFCLRQAGSVLANSVLGYALLSSSAAFGQTPAVAPTTPPAPPSTAPQATPAAPVTAPQVANPGQSTNGQNDGNFTIRTNVNEGK